MLTYLYPTSLSYGNRATNIFIAVWVFQKNTFKLWKCLEFPYQMKVQVLQVHVTEREMSRINCLIFRLIAKLLDEIFTSVRVLMNEVI